MQEQWKRTAIVKAGGVIEVVLSALTPGEVVEIVISTNGLNHKTPVKPPAGFGFARGMIHMSDDFDAPLNDFKDYL